MSQAGLAYLGAGVVGIVLGLLFREFFPGYLREKGKNVATKEDVGEITRKVEAVRVEHSAALERIRSNLERTVHVHRIQFEAEFRAYEQIWEHVIALTVATQALRPMFDMAVTGEEEGAERKKSRLEEFNRRYQAVADIIQSKSPFYPKQVWIEFTRVIKVTHGEAVDYIVHDPGDDPEYWRKAKKNYDDLIETIGDVEDVMRKRLEQLQIVQE